MDRIIFFEAFGDFLLGLSLALKTKNAQNLKFLAKKTALICYAGIYENIPEKIWEKIDPITNEPGSTLPDELQKTLFEEAKHAVQTEFFKKICESDETKVKSFLEHADLLSNEPLYRKYCKDRYELHFPLFVAKQRLADGKPIFPEKFVELFCQLKRFAADKKEFLPEESVKILCHFLSHPQ